MKNWVKGDREGVTWPTFAVLAVKYFTYLKHTALDRLQVRLNVILFRWKYYRTPILRNGCTVCCCCRLVAWWCLVVLLVHHTEVNLRMRLSAFTVGLFVKLSREALPNWWMSEKVVEFKLQCSWQKAWEIGRNAESGKIIDLNSVVTKGMNCASLVIPAGAWCMYESSNRRSHYTLHRFFCLSYGLEAFIF